MRLLKRWVKGFYMSLSMFCAIPMPIHIWDDAGMNLMLPCFPLIGALIGAIWWGAAQLLVLGRIHLVLAAAILTVVPFLLTGFLHLDGYIDTSDAVLSRRSPEDKLRILKDPHLGAFSVIMIAILFLLQFAAAYTVLDGEKAIVLLVVIATLSRCCGALSILSLPAMEQSGYAKMFKQNIRIAHYIFCYLVAIVAVAAAYWLAGWQGLIVAAATVLGSIGALAYAYKEFKGTSGDLTGFALVIGELCGLIALGVTPCF